MRKLLFVLLLLTNICYAQFPMAMGAAGQATAQSGTPLTFYQSNLSTPYPGATAGTVTYASANGVAYGDPVLTGDGFFEFKIFYGAGSENLNITFAHSDNITSYQLGTARDANIAIPRYNGNAQGSNQSLSGTLKTAWIRFNRSGNTISFTYSATQGGAQTTFWSFSQASPSGGTYRVNISGNSTNGITNATRNP